jgi:hypothetical protein
VIETRFLGICRPLAARCLSCLQRSDDDNRQRKDEKKPRVDCIPERVDAWDGGCISLAPQCVYEGGDEYYEKEHEVKNVPRRVEVVPAVIRGFGLM